MLSFALSYVEQLPGAWGTPKCRGARLTSSTSIL